ncbi:MAG TPA: hypothetical protein VHT29_00775 [Solirubrobacteraceae bacterium]|nr:hypothetical protein [Solirubrobacteraceae bacterium]
MSTTAAIIIAALVAFVLGDIAAVHALLKRRRDKDGTRQPPSNRRTKR